MRTFKRTDRKHDFQERRDARKAKLSKMRSDQRRQQELEDDFDADEVLDDEVSA